MTMEMSALFWLIALPLLATPLVYFSGHLGQTAVRGASVNGRAARDVALAALLACWLPFTWAARDLAQTDALTLTWGAMALRLDGLGLLLAAVALVLGTLVALYSGPYLATERGQEKYYAMLVAIVGVMIALGCAADLFNLWVWFEAMAVASYLLVAFYHEQPASLEAGVKYLVQSAVGSVLVLLGIGLVLANTATLDLQGIGEVVAARGVVSPILLAAGALFLIGFGVKVALVPLHTWLPDAHSQAPSGISAMLSGVVIEAGLVALLRSLGPLTAVAGAATIWAILLAGFGALNMLVGNLLALRQTQVKRMLAYSSLVHVGYMLVGVSVALFTGTAVGAAGGLFHLLNHGLMKGLAFLAAGALLYVLHLAVGDHHPLTVSDLAGAARRYPLAALTLSLALLSLGGLPPLAGFMSKWQIFVAGFQAHNVWIAALVIFAALNSVLSLAYYAPLVNSLYRLKSSDLVWAGKPMPWAMSLALVALALPVVAIGLWPGLVRWLTEPAGVALLAVFGR
ncbi:MAG: NADH dehydrogenase [Anaerolinea sp.]|nr:NADH dehydrogenase [Anaerolinea sp.]